MSAEKKDKIKDDNEEIVKEFLKSNGCKMGIDTEEEVAYISFSGSLIDNLSGNVIKEDEEYTITFPAKQIKNMIYAMMKVGMKYQEFTKQDIGFGKGGEEDE